MQRARDPEALRKVFEESPLSYRALARAAQCSRNTPGRLLAGKPTNDITARLLAKSLGRPLGELFVDAVSNGEPLCDKQKAVA